VNTFVLERISGRRSWRTVVSLARKRARLLGRKILNEQDRIYKRGKLHRVDSYYRLVREPRKARAETPLLRGHDVAGLR
jgi:hypothetical protein